MALEVGSIVEGTVSGIAKFGAFVELPENKVGLVHISEVANEYVSDVAQYLKVKDTVKVKEDHLHRCEGQDRSFCQAGAAEDGRKEGGTFSEEGRKRASFPEKRRLRGKNSSA